MKEALTQAEHQMHTDEFAVSIGKLHVLCELVLDDTNEQKRGDHRSTLTGEQVIVNTPQQPLSTQMVVENEKDDSIFDF